MHCLYLQEGPTCVINEDEFFDAVDASLDKLESEADSEYERNRPHFGTIIRHTPTANTPGSMLSLQSHHRLYAEVSSLGLMVSSFDVSYDCQSVEMSILSTSQDYGSSSILPSKMGDTVSDLFE